MVKKDKDLTEILDSFLKQKVHERFEKKFFRDFHKKLGITIKRNQPPKKRLVVENSIYSIVPLGKILDYNFIDILAAFIQKKNRWLNDLSLLPPIAYNHKRS